MPMMNTGLILALWGALASPAPPVPPPGSGATPSPSPAPAASPGDAEPDEVRPEVVRLLEAARRGELEVVKRLVEAGEPVNQPPGWRTPLIAAALHDHVAVMEYLLAKGADVNARDRQGRSALWAAVWGGRMEAFRLLLARGGDVNVASALGEPLLFQAVERGRHEMVRLLLDKGAHVDQPSKHPLWPAYTPLHRAVTLRDLETVRVLLARGADPRRVTGRGQTAADLAQGAGAEEIRATIDAALARREPSPAPK